MPQTDALLRRLLHVLTNSPQPQAVARTMALGTLQLLGPRYVTVHAVVGDTLELRSHFGTAPERNLLAARIPCDAPAPEGRAAQEVAVQRVQYADPSGRHPLLAHHDITPGGELLCLPLLHEARAVGVLSLQLPQPAMEDWTTRDLLEGTCAALALWLLSDARNAPTPHAGTRLRVTDRQRKVLDGLRRGLTNAAVAAELGFSIGTIKADITNLSALLGASGREDLLRKVGQAGL